MITTDLPNKKQVLMMFLCILIPICPFIIINTFPDFDSFTSKQSKTTVIEAFNENQNIFSRVAEYISKIDGDILITLNKNSKINVKRLKTEKEELSYISDSQVQKDMLIIFKKLHFEIIGKEHNSIIFDKRSSVGFLRKIIYHGVAIIKDESYLKDMGISSYDKLNEKWI